ncbi:nuclease-related domain-containing protein [Fictibacillus sp. b24]|uniref:nuclease-related domain-containing protein n=1 Tax=Fictibacillus sp. b24 TaxID=3055863 RepID=UPI0025A0281F|nr:nuclease-related domain-containing protein [Fictibacillus sp. b24]MDM5315132.1 nuclease-related domain-containing protein [Fictibacillus sp. b24]
MIIKHRSQPIIINKLESLLKRSPLLDEKREEIRDALRKFVSGYRGEQSMDYFYRYLPPNNLSILHGLRILHQDYFFQMDTLIITPNFLLIIECKNIAGHLYFESSYDPMIRTYNAQREGFDNPVEQVKRQSYHLMSILKNLKSLTIPIESLVVITNPTTITEFSPAYKEARSKIIKSSGIVSKFDEVSNKHQKEILQAKEIKRIIKHLLKHHTPENPDVCQKFQINPDSLLKGVFCPKCDMAFLKRLQRSWYCSKCRKVYKNAHESALLDYALLVSMTITNKKCKEFLNLPSTSQGYHILKSLNLPFTGNRKSRIYHLDDLVKNITTKEDLLP